MGNPQHTTSRGIRTINPSDSSNHSTRDDRDGKAKRNHSFSRIREHATTNDLGKDCQRPVRTACPRYGRAAASIHASHLSNGSIEYRIELPDHAETAGEHERCSLDGRPERSEEHTSELQSPYDLVCRLL